MPPLHWCHNGRDSISNHQLHDCLLNRLFRRRSKKTSKLRATGLCVGNSPGTGEFPAQMASYAENVSIWWRHHIWLHWLPNFSTSQSVTGRVYHPLLTLNICNISTIASTGNDIFHIIYLQHSYGLPGFRGSLFICHSQNTTNRKYKDYVYGRC